MNTCRSPVPARERVLLAEKQVIYTIVDLQQLFMDNLD